MFLPQNPFIRGQIVSPGRIKGKVSTAEFQKPGFPIMAQMPCFFREQKQKGRRSQELGIGVEERGVGIVT